MTSQPVTTEVRLSELMLPVFHGVHASIKKQEYLKYVLKGGRGSGKSSHIVLEIILQIIEYPVTALCVRKVGNTLQESCYEQLKEAIDYLQVSHLFKFNLSPLRITYLPRGNSIIFRGADDPIKIKSIKVAKFPITILWIEELAEFKVEDEVSTIEKSVLRAELPPGLAYLFLYSYNPPKRKQSWVNKKFETQFLPKNTFVHHSTYLDNKYLSREFLEEAEIVKERSPKTYDWEYLGHPIGAGVVPFDNLLFRTILDEEIAEFDNIRQGLDWGYATDPLAFGRMHYDKKRRRIYIFGEIYGVKIKNRELYNALHQNGWDDTLILADNEPRSIAEMRDYGLRMRAVKKGPGSVEYGEEWLNDLEAIVIDPVRCPNTAREFENIDYQIDADGNPRPRLEDKDNHSIDMTRYAMNEDMRKPLYDF